VPPQPSRVGAVVYHEKVRQIWDAFGDWFSEQGLALIFWLIGVVAGAIWWARGIEARGLTLETLAQPS